MRTIILENMKVMIAIIVTLIFFGIWVWLVYDRESGIPNVIDTYVQEPIMYRTITDADKDSISDVYENLKVPYFTVSDTKKYDIVGKELSGAIDKPYKFYYIPLSVLNSGVSVVNGNGAKYAVNIEVYKPKIGVDGQVQIAQVHAKDSYGNLLYDNNGNSIMTNTIDYEKSFISNYSWGDTNINISSLPNAYSQESKRGYDYIGVQKINGKDVILFNDFYPLKLVATYRCLVGTFKAEFTAVYYAGGSIDGSNTDLGYDEFEQWFGN